VRGKGREETSGPTSSLLTSERGARRGEETPQRAPPGLRKKKREGEEAKSLT